MFGCVTVCSVCLCVCCGGRGISATGEDTHSEVIIRDGPGKLRYSVIQRVKGQGNLLSIYSFRVHLSIVHWPTWSNLRWRNSKFSVRDTKLFSWRVWFATPYFCVLFTTARLFYYFLLLTLFCRFLLPLILSLSPFFPLSLLSCVSAVIMFATHCRFAYQILR